MYNFYIITLKQNNKFNFSLVEVLVENRHPMLKNFISLFTAKKIVCI